MSDQELDLNKSIVDAVKAMELLGTEEDAESELAALLRDSAGKPTARQLILTTLRICARLPAAEEYVRIEAEAREYARIIKERAVSTAKGEATKIVKNAEYDLVNQQQRGRRNDFEHRERMASLKKKEEELDQRLQEMTSPHAPALALLKSVVDQYPLPKGEKLPPTAFLSACALVASLMGTNPVDLSLKFSGNSVEFAPKGKD